MSTAQGRAGHPEIGGFGRFADPGRPRDRLTAFFLGSVQRVVVM
jgi:hypothetical protein